MLLKNTVVLSVLIFLSPFYIRVAIRDMVVRGAPAIAIAAALSLAVEVSNLKDFSGTSDDPASFLGKKLEYLVSRYGFSKRNIACSGLKF